MNLERNDTNEPNFSAQKMRHSRVFLKSMLGSLMGWSHILERGLKRRLLKPRRRRFSHLQDPGVIADPLKKLVRQSLVIAGALLVVTSIIPSQILETGLTADYFDSDTDFLQEGDELAPPPFFMNEEGFVLKSSPVTEDASRIGYTDSVKHTIVSGDNLSSIAVLYGVSVKTITWENNISETTPLTIGQILTIPALNGVTHMVSGASETLSSIAKSYGVEVSLIKEHNKLASDDIQKGQKLFIPGGKKKDVEVAGVVRRVGSRSSSGRAPAANTFSAKVVMSTNAEPKEGRTLIFPTSGKVTQGFRAGHYAYDIANSSQPDIWSGADGTVVTASGGCPERDVRIDRSCGHGYGNYVVIDHGDGLQTLYAHMETIYVTDGEQVSRGQALGKMGNSGRTYGVTGLHLHWEVFQNGAKKNPGNYL